MNYKVKFNGGILTFTTEEAARRFVSVNGGQYVGSSDNRRKSDSDFHNPVIRNGIAYRGR